MRKILMLLMAFMPMFVHAQNGKAIVTLKNGTEISGIIKSIDPTDAITIVIAGVETSIKMNDVAKVEETTTTTNNLSTPSDSQLDEKTKLIVTDFNDYPESFDLIVGDKPLK